MNILLVSGLLIPFAYIFMYVLGGALRPGYDHISDSVSELLSPGAPNRTLLTLIQAVYAAFHILFGMGVVRFMQRGEGDGILGQVGGWMIIALGIATIGTAIFPQDARGTPETVPGRVHKILVFGALIPLSILSTLSVGLWSQGIGSFQGFDIYSFVTVGAILIMGGVGGATVDTRYAGLVERLAAIVTQQWLFVLGLNLIFL